MKKTVSVSIDEKLWARFKDVAWSRKESASSFLERVIKVGLPKFSEDPARSFYNDDLPDIPKKGEIVADRIRDKMGSVDKSTRVVVDGLKKSPQERLDESRKGRDVKKEKIEMIWIIHLYRLIF